MALQTETSSSSSTSTSTSTSASATNTDNNQGSSGNLFDVSGSQPLILVFLAVGLFSAISIAILGWRRAYYVRSGMGVGHLHDANGEDAQNAGVGAKDRPKLWDLWTTTTVNPVPVPEVGQSRMEVEVEGISHGSESDHTQGRRGENSWANIMPIAVSPIVQAEDNHERHRSSAIETVQDSDVSDASRLLLRGRRLLLENLTTQFGPRRNRGGHAEQMIRSEHGRETGMMQNFRGPTQEQHSKGKGVLAQPDDGNNEDLREHESFQVAVAIAMPKPKENHGLDPGETVLDSEVYEYSIGVCRVPCG